MCEFSNRISFYKILLSIFFDVDVGAVVFTLLNSQILEERSMTAKYSGCLFGWMAGWLAEPYFLFCFACKQIKKHFFSQSVPCGGECDHYDDYG